MGRADRSLRFQLHIAPKNTPQRDPYVVGESSFDECCRRCDYTNFRQPESSRGSATRGSVNVTNPFPTAGAPSQNNECLSLTTPPSSVFGGRDNFSYVLSPGNETGDVCNPGLPPVYQTLDLTGLTSGLNGTSANESCKCDGPDETGRAAYQHTAHPEQHYGAQLLYKTKALWHNIRWGVVVCMPVCGGGV